MKNRNISTMKHNWIGRNKDLRSSGLFSCIQMAVILVSRHRKTINLVDLAHP